MPAPEYERRSIDSHVARLEERLRDHIIADQEDRKEIKEAIAALTHSISGLVQAWNTANSVGSLIKWLAGVGAAVLFLWSLLTGHWRP